MTTPYFLRTKQEHDAERTRHLYTTLQSAKSILSAEDYMLPLDTTADCARIQPGVKYKVTFRSGENKMYVVTFKNRIDCDEVEIVDDLRQFAGPIVVQEDSEITKSSPAPAEMKAEKPSEPVKRLRSNEALAKAAKEWWKNYSEKLWQEIGLVGDSEPISLGKEYRIPCQEILPYLDRQLRKESNGEFCFDSIDDDLIGTIAPIKQEKKEQPNRAKPAQQGKKPQMSRVDKFNARQSKKEA